MSPQRRSCGEAPPGQHDVDRVLHAVVHRLHAGPKQLVAVGEVDVEGGPGDAGLGRDLVHGDVGRAVLAEKAAGRIHDLVAAEVADDVLQRIGRAPGHRYLTRLRRPADSGADAGGGRERHGNVLDAIDELGL